MEIAIDDLTGPEIAELLTIHLENMAEISPPESRHALDLEALKRPDITFWSAWEDGKLASCAALKELDATHGEIKSMRTAAVFLRKGVAAKLLKHIINEATRRGYRQLSLETGSMTPFFPAHQLYERFGFVVCGPFAQYREDPNSVYMTKKLTDGK